MDVSNADETRTNLAGTRNGELTLSALTLRAAGFEDRVRAAAAAGFTGIGLRGDDYLAARAAGLDDAALRRIIAEAGLRVTEVEFLRDWTGGDGEASEHERTLFHVADLFGADRVHAGLFEPRPLGETIAAFARLCRRAERHRLSVALEFMPYSALPAPGAAWEVVSGAGRPNSGILVDAWHYHRCGPSAAELLDVPPERVVAVQLNDAAPQPFADLREESRHHRLLPGDGVIDLSGLLRLLTERGVVAPVAVEVPSDELDALEAAEAARRAASSTRRVLARAGRRRGSECDG